MTVAIDRMKTIVTMGSYSWRRVRAKVMPNAAGGAPNAIITRNATAEATRTRLPAEVRKSSRYASGYGLDAVVIGGSRWTTGTGRSSTVVYEPGQANSSFTFLRPAEAASCR